VVTVTDVEGPVLSVAVTVVSPCAIGITEKVAPAPLNVAAVAPTTVGSETRIASELKIPDDRVTVTDSGVLLSRAKLKVEGVAVKVIACAGGDARVGAGELLAPLHAGSVSRRAQMTVTILWLDAAVIASS